MSSAADPARDCRAELLRNIPPVDELLALPALAGLANRVGRELVVDAARSVLERLREEIRLGLSTQAVERDALAVAIAANVALLLTPSLRPVINATGVILHTNLGRAPLAETAIEHIRKTAGQYTNLEYDIAAGARGRRDVHTGALLARLTGAEAACVVNNNAAAVFLALAALARGGEVIVSRGELIEIGESFRIPDIMAESGALLREVGTTNRTSVADYEGAINERTRLLLRVHRSNFAIVGFTDRPTLDELADLSQRTRIPLYEDLGSGCLTDLGAQGVAEPVASASLKAGVDLVSFSGDKLMGGPQAGILAGRRDIIGRIRKHPLFRALRLDKLVIAALEATLLAYVRNDLDELPALRMIRAGGRGDRRARAANRQRVEADAEFNASRDRNHRRAIRDRRRIDSRRISAHALAAHYQREIFGCATRSAAPKRRSRPRRNGECRARSGARAYFRGLPGDRSANRVPVAGGRAHRSTHEGTHGALA